MRIIFFIFFCSILIACNKEPLPVTSIHEEEPFRILKLNVRHVYEITPDVRDSVIAGALIKLYLNDEDLQDDMYAKGTKTTNSSGVAIFEYLEKDHYHIKVYHPGFGTKTDTVFAPAGAITFLEITYY